MAKKHFFPIMEFRKFIDKNGDRKKQAQEFSDKYDIEGEMNATPSASMSM